MPPPAAAGTPCNSRTVARPGSEINTSAAPFPLQSSRVAVPSSVTVWASGRKP